MLNFFIKFIITLLALNACSTSHPSITTTQNKIYSRLTRHDPTIPKKQRLELARFLSLKYHALSKTYRRTLPPLLHNTLVNLGFYKYGLCYHYADAIYIGALKESENFPSYRFHLIVSDKGSYLFEHNAMAIVSKNKTLHEGVIVDAWRNPQRLTLAQLSRDRSYAWRHRDDRCLCYR